MTHDDVLFGFRMQLLSYAATHGVSAACRVFGVHRSTFYVWRRRAERHGMEILRPRERRTPRMPNQFSIQTEQQILAFSLAHPGFGPDRIAAELARERWGALGVSPSGVYRVLSRHGLNTRAKRLGMVAGYRSAWAPPRAPEPERHIEVTRPGELVGIDCFFVGRLRGTRQPVWQITAIDIYSSYGWADVVSCRQPTHIQTSRLARRVAADLGARAGGWSGCYPTTDLSLRASDSARSSASSVRRPRASEPGARRPTVTSRTCTRRSSTSAGARALPAACIPPTPPSSEICEPTFATTTPTGHTPGGLPKVVYRPTSSIPPERCTHDRSCLSGHLGTSPT